MGDFFKQTPPRRTMIKIPFPARPEDRNYDIHVTNQETVTIQQDGEDKVRVMPNGDIEIATGLDSPNAKWEIM